MTNLLTAQEAAKVIGLNAWTVRRMGYKEEIPVYRKGSAVRYNADEILAFMREQGKKQPVIHRPRKKVNGK